MDFHKTPYTYAITFVFIACTVLFTSLFVQAATPALESEYLTIVGYDSPASDVITAANFAGSMTGLGITFSGATDEDALNYYQTNEELYDHYFVVIDGKNILLLGTSEYSQQIQNYFKEQGFTVKTDARAERKDLVITANFARFDASDSSDEESDRESDLDIVVEQKPEPEPRPVLYEQTQEVECGACSFDGFCYEKGDLVVIDGATHYCDGSDIHTRKARGEACNADYECAGNISCSETCGKKPNAVERFFSWLANLF